MLLLPGKESALRNDQQCRVGLQSETCAERKGSTLADASYISKGVLAAHGIGLWWNMLLAETATVHGVSHS